MVQWFLPRWCSDETEHTLTVGEGLLDGVVSHERQQRQHLAQHLLDVRHRGVRVHRRQRAQRARDRVVRH